MLQGLRSAIYPVIDLERSRRWYRDLLGVAPYYDTDRYVGFEVGGYELGLFPGGDPGRCDVYWGVADIEAALATLLAAGATEHQAIHDVGDGIRMASVIEPGGAPLGIIENPHFRGGC